MDHSRSAKSVRGKSGESGNYSKLRENGRTGQSYAAGDGTDSARGRGWEIDSHRSSPS